MKKYTNSISEDFENNKIKKVFISILNLKFMYVRISNPFQTFAKLRIVINRNLLWLYITSFKWRKIKLSKIWEIHDKLYFSF